MLHQIQVLLTVTLVAEKDKEGHIKRLNRDLPLVCVLTRITIMLHFWLEGGLWKVAQTIGYVPIYADPVILSLLICFCWYSMGRRLTVVSRSVGSSLMVTRPSTSHHLICFGGGHNKFQSSLVMSYRPIYVSLCRLCWYQSVWEINIYIAYWQLYLQILTVYQAADLYIAHWQLHLQFCLAA